MNRPEGIKRPIFGQVIDNAKIGRDPNGIRIRVITPNSDTELLTFWPMDHSFGSIISGKVYKHGINMHPKQLFLRSIMETIAIATMRTLE